MPPEWAMFEEMRQAGWASDRLPEGISRNLVSSTPIVLSQASSHSDQRGVSRADTVLVFSLACGQHEPPNLN